ncbi:histidine kinase dimerization/phospho-acceptor domain-containing protein [Lactobacillus sp. PV012]|uniref:histidine kinase dimerization/phospho-acceptor domain-containing protein n=1 Tax=Lactobacillus sp. PV012 TaxID=2594494 RepID=UPI00223F44B9|nr:histidine kinase dimerization/phospho-acceptor domain-containing protein [Lactobacillus sp. PV012]QNQ81610.1 HAMP domain-containing histidine kinase [Lactobacillus sp. PV012]
MKNKSTSFSFLIVVYSAFLALVVAPLFGGAVGVSVYTGKSPHIIGWLMITLLFVLSFIVNYLVLTYLFTYVNKLTQAIKQVANGDFRIRLERNRFNPFDSTFSDFNHMVSELDSTKVMKEDFISKFSHEFKTPITSIHGFADLLLNQELSKQKQKEYLKIIAEESNRLSQLSTQIMKLTNLENKKIVTNKKKIEVDE